MNEFVQRGGNGELEDLVGDSLVMQIVHALRREIEAGVVKPGDKLPSEAELTRLHSVSRAVIREAVAILRHEGMLEARRGVGVFVSDAERSDRPFSGLSLERISSVIELLELRAAVRPRQRPLPHHAVRRRSLKPFSLCTARSAKGLIAASRPARRILPCIWRLPRQRRTAGSPIFCG